MNVLEAIREHVKNNAERKQAKIELNKKMLEEEQSIDAKSYGDVIEKVFAVLVTKILITPMQAIEYTKLYNAGCGFNTAPNLQEFMDAALDELNLKDVRVIFGWHTMDKVTHLFFADTVEDRVEIKSFAGMVYVFPSWKKTLEHVRQIYQAKIDAHNKELERYEKEHKAELELYAKVLAGKDAYDYLESTKWNFNHSFTPMTLSVVEDALKLHESELK